MTRPSILVVGLGGLGAITAARLHEAGHEVLGLVRTQQSAQALADGGIAILENGAVTHHNVPVTADVADRRFDFIILATQPPQTEAAAKGLVGNLSEGGAFVCMQNGLMEERLAKFVDPANVVGAIIAWGATMRATGDYEKTSGGGIVLGRLKASKGGDLKQLSELFGAVAPTKITDNLIGARFSKLALNCAISTLGTISGTPLGQFVRRRDARRAALKIMTEAVAVADGLGVVLEPIAGTLDLKKIVLDEGRTSLRGLLFRHAVILAVGFKYRKLRSSMLRAVESGRPPAVEFLNGEVAQRAAESGLAAPYNARATALVLRIGDGQLRPSNELLDAFCKGPEGWRRDDVTDSAGGPATAQPERH